MEGRKKMMNGKEGGGRPIPVSLNTLNERHT